MGITGKSWVNIDIDQILRERGNDMRLYTLVLALVIALTIGVVGAFVPKSAEAGGGGWGPTLPPTITISVPEQVEIDHKPFDLKVKIKNNATQTIWYDLVVWHGGSAWGREDYPYSMTGGEVYQVIGDTEGIRHFWKGSLLPEEEAVLTVPTFSGDILGRYKFVGIDALTTTSPHLHQLEKEVEVTKTTATPPIVITEVKPSMTVRPGNRVTILGKGFLPPKVDVSQLQVWLVHNDGGVYDLATVSPNKGDVAWDDKAVSFTMPADIPPQEGTLKVITGKSFADAPGVFRVITNPTPTATSSPMPSTSLTAEVGCVRQLVPSSGQFSVTLKGSIPFAVKWSPPRRPFQTPTPQSKE